MILSETELLDVVVRKPNKDLIAFGHEQRKRARMHMYGVGMNEHLTMIEGFEKPWLKQIRTKYVQSNKDLFSRLSKPINKIFTARGGSTYYNLSSSENDRVGIIDQNIVRRTSVKKWMETYWKTHVLDDPMGLVFMEIDEKGNAYPTYKSIKDIIDYKLEHGKLEYVVFDVSADEKKRLGLENESTVYRVVDDLYDKIVILKDQTKIVEVEDQTFLNYFGFVPGIVNSPFVNPDGDGYVSPFYWIYDLADQYLLKISIRITHELRHGFPKYYEFADDCLDCKGTGKVKAKDCSGCNGTGKKLMTHVSDVKLLEYPTKDTPGLRGAPGGYIEPSEIFWNIVTSGLAELEERINQTMWGSKSTTNLKPGLGLSAAPNGIVTATEVMDNRQPEIETLNIFSDAVEIRDKFVIDSAVTVMLNKKDYINSGGCSKNYGRRFLIEEPDALLNRYADARKQGVSPSILFGLYEQYLESKYQSDGVSLSLQKKLMRIEPFLHYTVSELKMNGATPEELRSKIYYGEWLAQMNNNSLILASTNTLKNNFDEFISTKPLIVPEKVLDKPRIGS